MTPTPALAVRATALATTLTLRPDAGAAFGRWQARAARIAAGFPGFLSIDSQPHYPGAAGWRIVQQFRDAGDLARWAASAERQGLQADLAALCQDGPTDQDLPQHDTAGVTEVIATAVRPGREAEFRDWAETIQAAQGTFPGYMGTYIQAPASTAQPFWTTLVRFATPGQLDAWLTSDIRRDLVARSDAFVERWESRRLPSSFAGWFPEAAGRPAPAKWKQTAIVLLVLFPIVMLEMRFLSPLLSGLNVAVGTFIGNLISVSLVSWPLAPLAIKALGWWLQAPAGSRRRAEILGGATIAALYALEIALFWR